MKYRLYRNLLFLMLFFYNQLFAISMVYNFRIAQITKQPIFDDHRHKDHTLIALIFDQFRKKRTCVYQNFIGGLGAYVYYYKSYYLRTDFAVSHIKENTNHVTTFSGTETDDILFTAGKNIAFDNERVTFSGLFGIPTHKILRLQHTDFGYSQVGLGGQVDGAHYVNTNNSILYGARYIYFVPRDARDCSGKKYNFTLGNIADALIAYKNAANHHGFEVGYTTRFRFGAHICPNLDDIVKKTNYIRSNFYAVYKYKFRANEISNRLLFYIGYGFDHSPKKFGNEYIVTLWSSWNINF